MHSVVKTFSFIVVLAAVLGYGGFRLGMRLEALYSEPDSDPDPIVAHVIVAHINHPGWFHRAKFPMPYDPDDSMGSIAACLDEVHKRGGGQCEIGPKDIAPGIHNELHRGWPDSEVLVTQPDSL